MQHRLRLFVAVSLPAPVQAAVSRTIQHLASALPQVRWVRPEQLHITLKFLGEVDNRQLPLICDLVQNAAQQVEGFTASLEELGTFPKGRPPRVVWLSMQQGVNELRAIHDRLDEALVELGVPREARLFTPHLTLGRVGRTQDVAAIPEALARCWPQGVLKVEVDQLDLMSSSGRNSGHGYETLHVAALR